MKLLVFSDSHGAVYKMRSAVKNHPDADMILFLGDGLRDADTVFDELPDIPHAAVTGNCDFTSTYGSETYLSEQTLDLGGIRIFMCHGHKYGAKSTQMNLWMRGLEKEASLVLFGHTHEPFEHVIDGVRLFNPGSIGQGSYGIIYIENASVLASHGRV